MYKRFDGDNPRYTQATRLKTFINTLLVAFAGTTSWLKNYAMCLGFLRHGFPLPAQPKSYLKSFEFYFSLWLIFLFSQTVKIIKFYLQE